MAACRFRQSVVIASITMCMCGCYIQSHIPEGVSTGRSEGQEPNRRGLLQILGEIWRGNLEKIRVHQ